MHIHQDATGPWAASSDLVDEKIFPSLDFLMLVKKDPEEECGRSGFCCESARTVSMILQIKVISLVISLQYVHFGWDLQKLFHIQC